MNVLSEAVGVASPPQTKDARAASPAAKRARRVWSIRWIVTAAMVALTAGSVVGVGTVTEGNARRALETEMKAQLQLQARNLAMVAGGALLSELPEWTLLPLIKETRERQSHLAFVVVVDRAGVIQGDSDVRRLGTPFVSPLGLAPEGPPGGAGETLYRGRDLLAASAPILHGSHRIGTAWVGLERSAIQMRLDRARREQLAMLGLFLLVGTGSALLLSSLLLRPIGALRAGLERIGRGDLETRIQVGDRTELGALAEAVNRMAGELKTAQVELVERERIAHEVQVARRIQRSLLPTGGRLAGPFVIEGMQRPAAEVGGDYYQTLDLPGGRIGLVVADVSGKGLAGSLVTAMLHATLRPMMALHDSPARMLADLDRQIAAMLERGSFVTLFYGILDPERGDVRFASAGHNPVLVIRESGKIDWVQAPGVPLAAVRGGRKPAIYQDATIHLDAGDILVQYTDGIHEAFAQDDELAFGLDRVAEAAASAARGGCRAVLEALTRAVDAWRDGAPQHDDETLLVVSREMDRPAAGAQSEADGLVLLTEARLRGRRLTLPATLKALVRLDDWLPTLPELSGLEPRTAGLVRLALYELCSNVVEHAYQKDAERTFDLWWLPAPPAALATTASQAAVALPASGRGFFVLCDRGVSFRYQSQERPRFEDPKVRRRGRGFGLEIVRRVMKSVTYHPDTPEGNLTCLGFEPGGVAIEEEQHGHHG